MRPQHAAEHIQSPTEVEVRTLRQCLYLSVATLIWAFGLIALGAMVSATDAAGQCSGWPLCNGQLSPASDLEGSLIFGHRFGGFAILMLSTALVGLTQLRLARTSFIARFALAVFVLILAQSVLGGFAVVQELPRFIVGAHLLLALAVSSALTMLIVLIHQRLRVTRTAASGNLIALPQHLTGYVRAIALLTVVSALAASASDGLPGISTAAIRTGFGSPGGLLALQVISVALLWLFSAFFLADVLRTQAISTTARKIAYTGSAGLLLTLPLGVAAGSFDAPAVVEVLPLALVSLGLSAMIALMTGTHLATPSMTIGLPSTLRIKAGMRDFLRVSKPAIMVLLLITTLGAMLIAAQGWPSFGVVLLTLLGGALASGGASALNCYYDRDIDGVMARTRKRPIPTGGLTPDQVRAWGLTLSILAVVVLAVFVNPLAATMALAGNLFYVLIYTRKLKRSTPQNIVIGGAAGSFPPLVGWAAVTGSLSLGAFLIAAIIFYWTPPHFWSLALLKANDYKRAGIPMLPVTHGEHETRRRIVLYSFLLLAVTLLMVPAGVVGLVYGVTAAVLGVWFVVMAVRMFREDTTRLAWPLFKYSNYYLAALLAAMAVDHALRF